MRRFELPGCGRAFACLPRPSAGCTRCRHAQNTRIVCPQLAALWKGVGARAEAKWEQCSVPGHPRLAGEAALHFACRPACDERPAEAGGQGLEAHGRHAAGGAGAGADGCVCCAAARSSHASPPSHAFQACNPDHLAGTLPCGLPTTVDPASRTCAPPGTPNRASCCAVAWLTRLRCCMVDSPGWPTWYHLPQSRWSARRTTSSTP